MLAMEALHESRAKRGATVIGITREYKKRGLLPHSRDELKKKYRKGETYKGETFEEYMEHLKAFRQRTQIKFPFAVGTGEDFKKYHVSGIPTVFVVDRKGVVTFIAVGGMKEHMLGIAVDRALDQVSDENAELPERNRKTISAFQAARDAAGKALTMRIRARAELAGAKDGAARLNARDRLAAARREAVRLEWGALETFRKAFQASNWTAWRLPEHAGLLEQGLLLTGRNGIHEDPELAVLAFEFLLRMLPESSQASRVRSEYLPVALLSGDDVKAGAARIRELARSAPEPERPLLTVYVADAEAMLGDLEAAKATYRRAAGMVPADLPPRERLSRVRRVALERAELLGSPAPELDSKIWVGGEPQALSAMKGKVVVVNFWASVYGQCRIALPALDKMASQHEPDDLQVLAVARTYAYGYLPKDAAALASPIGEAERVEGIRDEYTKHLREFHRRSGLSIPFVQGTLEDFDLFKVGGIPAYYVIDRTGRIVFTATGPEKIRMVSSVVDRLLGVTHDK